MENQNNQSKPMGLIYKKMSAVMADIGAIGKNQKNTAQGYKFRGVDDFVNALNPALIKHGVFMTPHLSNIAYELRDVTRSNGKAGTDKHVNLSMVYTFYAEDGSSLAIGPIPAEGLDSGDKATNKALSAALKYGLIQTFSIPTEDMAEADLETPVIGKAAPVTKLVEPVVINGGLSLEGLEEQGTTVVIETATPKPQSNGSSFRKSNETVTPAAKKNVLEGW